MLVTMASRSMTAKEKLECKAILSLMNPKDIMHLQQTVVKGTSREDKKEAIDLIVGNSSGAKTLLRRKKVRRRVLVKYLAMKSVRVKRSADKQDLINRILELWRSRNRSDTKHTGISIQPSTPVMTSLAKPAEPPEKKPPEETPMEIRGTEKIPFESQRNQAKGEKFVTMFYKALHTENPEVSGAPTLVDFGPEMFCEDCSLRIVMKTRVEKEIKCKNKNNVSQELKDFVKQENVKFKPSINQEGVHTVTRHDGLFVVMVHGTVHRQDDCLGIFEQMFCFEHKSFESEHKCTIKKTSLKVTYFSKLNATADQDMQTFAESKE